MPITLPTTLEVPLWQDEYGTIRVKGTRILLEVVIDAFHQGLTVETLVSNYDTLKPSDIYLIWAFYLTHHTELDAYLEASAKEDLEIEQDIIATYTTETQVWLETLRSLDQETLNIFS